eukprot:scaffold1437_cov164-Skeletonema_marinoi.AAC.6
MSRPEHPPLMLATEYASTPAGSDAFFLRFLEQNLTPTLHPSFYYSYNTDSICCPSLSHPTTAYLLRYAHTSVVRYNCPALTLRLSTPRSLYLWRLYS